MAARGVRVNSVNPGVVPTQIFTSSGMDPAAASQYFQDSKVLSCRKLPGSGVNGYVVFTNKLGDSFVVRRVDVTQEVTKRCRLSWLTNGTLVVAGSQPMSTAVHLEPKSTLEI